MAIKRLYDKYPILFDFTKTTAGVPLLSPQIVPMLLPQIIPMGVSVKKLPITVKVPNATHALTKIAIKIKGDPI